MKDFGAPTEASRVQTPERTFGSFKHENFLIFLYVSDWKTVPWCAWCGRASVRPRGAGGGSRRRCSGPPSWSWRWGSSARWCASQGRAKRSRLYTQGDSLWAHKNLWKTDYKPKFYKKCGLFSLVIRWIRIPDQSKKRAAIQIHNSVAAPFEISAKYRYLLYICSPFCCTFLVLFMGHIFSAFL